MQYKKEDNVPETVRRSIYRVSALLETVDLEFERVLSERENYIKELKPDTQDVTLNVDMLKNILDVLLPYENRDDDEDYSNLLIDLSNCRIDKSSQLISLINEKLEAALKQDKEIVKHKQEHYKETGAIEIDDDERAITSGVFYAHTGLVRQMLERKFGNHWRQMR